MDLDSEIIGRFATVDVTDDASIPGLLSPEENQWESDISRMMNSGPGTVNRDVPVPASFSSTMDKAIRSSGIIVPNQGASHVHSYDSVVNDAIRSSGRGVAEWKGERKMLKLMQNEEQRMNELNRLMDALGAVVPSVLTTNTEQSVLRQATSFITEMKSKLQTIESDNSSNKSSNEAALIDLEVDVKDVDGDAMIRIRCRNKNDSAERVRMALVELGLIWRYSKASVENDFMIQDWRITKDSFNTHERLRSALSSKLSSLKIENIKPNFTPNPPPQQLGFGMILK